MATAYGTSNSATMASASGANSLVITKPTSLAVGDLMIAFIGVARTAGAASIATPSGWTLLESVLSDNPIARVFFKVADSSDVAASNFTFSVTVDAANYGIGGSIIRVTGTNGFTGVDNFTHTGAVDTNSGTSAKSFASSIIPPTSSSLYLMATFASAIVGSVSTYAIVTNNPTWTERVDSNINVSNTDLTFAVATAPASAHATSGNFSLTLSANAGALGFLIAVNENLTADGNHPILTMTSHIFTTGISVGTQVTHTILTMASHIFSGNKGRIIANRWSSVKKTLKTWTSRKQ